MAAVVFPPAPVNGQVWPNDAPTHVWNVAANEWLALQPSFKGRLVATSIDLGSASNPDPAIVATWLLNHRELLFNYLYLYVRTDGNDGNDGLTNVAGGSPNFNGAFLTIQAAVDKALTYDFNGCVVTIKVGGGTYARGAVAYQNGSMISDAYMARPDGTYVSGGYLQILGDTTSPGNVIISATSGSCFSFDGEAYFFVAGFKLTNSNGNGIVANFKANVEWGNMEFGACAGSNSYHVALYAGGHAQAYVNYTISGAALSHIITDLHCTAEMGYGNTVTITGTPAFTNGFVACINTSIIRWPSVTFSGATTGKRYQVGYGSSLKTGSGASATYFPGDIAGSGTGEYT